MRIILVVGTRPQIVKASVLLDALDASGVETVLVHTGQHYSSRLSNDLFEELNIRLPDYNLAVGSGSYKYQIEEGVKKLGQIVTSVRPNAVLTIGDSNPALVGTLAAVLHAVTVVHSEAGLRSGNTREPEERNRLIVDSLADLLFASTEECIANLSLESAAGLKVLTGDLLLDVWRKYDGQSVKPEELPDERARDGFCLLTLHRKSNMYTRSTCEKIVKLLEDVDFGGPCVWPMHPGVAEQLRLYNLHGRIMSNENVSLLPPVTYLEMKWLVENSVYVVTDSVGLQVEAYLARKPSVIFRNEVEYSSIEALGWSARASAHATPEALQSLLHTFVHREARPYDKDLFGHGSAAIEMTEKIKHLIDNS